MSPIEFFGDHTYRMVFFGTAVIGLVAGALGSFAYLRKQSLISDVISHAALPGTLLAFLVAVAIGADGRAMPALILGAVLAGTAAVWSANGIAHGSKIRIDTAMAITLTIFFGVGMLLMRVIANGVFPGKGGIQDYLFGNASVITEADLATSLAFGAVAVGLTALLWQAFAIRTFDADAATVLGFGGRLIDALLFTVIVIATVIGVKAVGLVLMVAFVITPPAAARQWVHSLGGMVWLAGAFGALGSAAGAYLSIVWSVPTGPVIVLVLFGMLVLSLLLAPRRSVITRAIARSRARRELRTELMQEAGRA